MAQKAIITKRSAMRTGHSGRHATRQTRLSSSLACDRSSRRIMKRPRNRISKNRNGAMVIATATPEL